MAILRYALQNKKLGLAIEAEYNEDGKNFLLNLRKNDPNFKGFRFKDWIQCIPDHCQLKTVFQTN